MDHIRHACMYLHTLRSVLAWFADFYWSRCSYNFKVLLWIRYLFYGKILKFLKTQFNSEIPKKILQIKMHVLHIDFIVAVCFD